MRAIFAIWTAVVIHSAPALANESSIGNVHTFKPEVVILRKGVEHTVGLGAPVHRGDVIVTQRTGAVGVVFLDGSVLSLGPSTTFFIDEFTFEPDKKDVSFMSRLQKGTASFLSGAIGRISPAAVRFKTPTATLGLRGTKVLVQVR